MIILATPNSNTTGTLRFEYYIDGRVMPWYWQFYFKQLDTPEGKKMMIFGLVLLGLVAICWCVSMGVCIRHCILRALCPDAFGYKEDIEEKEALEFE